jgi:hypothetical protein
MYILAESTKMSGADRVGPVSVTLHIFSIKPQ